MTSPLPEPSKAARAGSTQRRRRRRVLLRGFWFDALTLEETIGDVLEALEAGCGGWLVTSNLDHLRRAERDAGFAGHLRDAELLVADGMPLVWASRLAGDPLPERVAGSTLSEKLAEAAAGAGRSLMLLGGNPGVAEAAASSLREQHPGIHIAGTHCPPVGFESDPTASAALRAALRASKADVVYVALGSPKQEKLIAELRGEGLLPGAWWIGVGISLSFLCGEVSRAPGWAQAAGLEWAHRLIQEPRRLARRYLMDGLPYAGRLLLGAVLTRLRPRGVAASSASGAVPYSTSFDPTGGGTRN